MIGMSIESAQLFFGRLKEDREFRVMILSSRSQAEAEKLVRAQGYIFTADEVRSLFDPEETVISGNCCANG
jgi:hypothetical protein